MERQLKERLIGAAILVAVAVIMVPEMFSGRPSHSEAAADSSSASSGQIKTYHIELQSAHSSDAVLQAAVEPPAAQPRDEAPLPVDDRNAVEPSSHASSARAVSVARASSVPSHLVNEPEPVMAKPALKPASAPAAEAPSKVVTTEKPAEGDWVVQVGSFGAEDKARQIVGKLKDQGYPAYLGKVTVAGKTLYRVRVGTMPSRAAAEASLQKIKTAYPAASVVPANR